LRGLLLLILLLLFLLLLRLFRLLFLLLLLLAVVIQLLTFRRLCPSLTLRAALARVTLRVSTEYASGVVAVIGQENILQTERAELVRRVSLRVTQRLVLCSRRLCLRSNSRLRSSSVAVAILINLHFLPQLFVLHLPHILLLSTLYFAMP
jgi:hypothetical protein